MDVYWEMLLVFILIYIFLNYFSYGLFFDLDIIAKMKNLKLIKLGKFRFFFTRNKNIKEKKDYIGYRSYRLQIIHLIFTISIFCIVLINIFLNIDIIFKICFIATQLYFLYIIILLTKNNKDSIDCKQMLINIIREEEEQRAAEIERQKIIDKFTKKD